MYTRESFAAQRAKSKVIEKSLGRLTAAVAVTLGVGQLLFIRLIGGRIDKNKELTFELLLVVAYLIVVGFLVWQMDRQVTAARPVCPKCRVSFKGAADAAAMTTGKCSACGAQVFEP